MQKDQGIIDPMLATILRKLKPMPVSRGKKSAGFFVALLQDNLQMGAFS